MKKLLYYFLKCACIAMYIFFIPANAASLSDPLPSWNDGPIKQNIIQFVKEVTDQSSPNYVIPESRIAAFDNDGTLWVEKPIYTQGIFMFDQIKALLTSHPEWKSQKPYSAILSGNKQALSRLSVQDIEKIIAVTHSGMTVSEFKEIVQDWLATAVDPHFKRHYTQLVYKPMLEVMQYLRDNNFKIYIVTGGGQEFVRAFSKNTYQVMPEQVIGTAMKTKYTYQNNKPELVKVPAILIVDDNAGKPEAINLFIGRRPIIAFGNSDGDREMLEWTQAGKKNNLVLLVHHDDAKREYAYGAKSKVGTFSDSLMQEAQVKNWNIISMKNDWKVIFP